LLVIRRKVSIKVGLPDNSPSKANWK
jgi:hypothetical protein